MKDERIIEDGSFIDLPGGGFVLYLELKNKEEVDPIECTFDWDDFGFMVNDLPGLKVCELTEYLDKLEVFIGRRR
jgi:hypothetical protein